MLHDRCSYWLFLRLLLKEEIHVERRRLIPGQKNPARYKPLQFGSTGAFSDIWTVSLDGCECQCHIKGERIISTSAQGYVEEEFYFVFDLVGSQAGYSRFQVTGIIKGFFWV